MSEKNEDDLFEPTKHKKLKLDTNHGDEENGISNGNTLDNDEGTQDYNLEDEVGELLEQDTQPYSLDSVDDEAVNHLEVNTNRKSGEVQKKGNAAGTSMLDDKIQSKPCLNKIESVLKDAEFIASIVSDVNVSEVYDKLKERRQNPNRVDIVTNELLENSKTASNSSKGETSAAAAAALEDFVKVIDKTMNNISTLPLTADEINQMLDKCKNRRDRVDFVVSQILVIHYRKKDHQQADLVDDMRKVLPQVPGAEPDMVYRILEENKHCTNRIQKTVDVLKNETSDRGSLKTADSFPDDPNLQSDPLYRDMRIVAKVITNRDKNEIYAFLEAHHEKKNRIRVVIEELMRTGDRDPSLEPSVDGHTTTTSDVTGAGKGFPKNIQEEVDELREIFPDCDPNYLFEELENRKEDRERLKNLAMFMFDCKNYPKLMDVTKTQQKENFKQKYQNMALNLEEFLVKFPDPDEAFLNEGKQVNENYKDHCLKQLLTDFKDLKKGYIKQILESHNFHYAPTKKQIWREKIISSPTSKIYRRRPRVDNAETKMPEEPNDFFYHEKLFVENEKSITDHLQEKKRLRETRLEEARKNQELLECECCFDDECLFEDMSACPEGHLFCKDCIKRSSEVVIGQGKTKFPCITGTCSEVFPLSILQSVLPANIFSIALSKMQEEEIKMADIPGLESCPFCSFATIMPDENYKVFKCLNPDCLKESCRLCKEPNHIPLHCDEIEKQGATNMRTYIEIKVSEAMLRKCHRCKKTFLKDYGCNKMTCTCGATSCYVCREPDIDYDHFDNNEMCNMNEDSNTIHKAEMLKAAEEAKQQYLLEHPDAADIDLKYDPLQHVEEYGDDVWDEDDYDSE